MSAPRLTIAAVCLALAACGGRRSTPSPAGPARGADLSALLPADAPLTATVRPHALVEVLRGLADRSVDFQRAFSHSDAAVVWDPGFLSAFTVDGERPAWFSVRSGCVAAVLQTAEDVSRVLQAPEQFSRWVAATQRPPAWIHVRLAGLRAPDARGEPAPDAWLTQRWGALQVLGPGDPVETWAAALDCPLATAHEVVAALAPLGAWRAWLLLETRSPVAVVVSVPPGGGGPSRPEDPAVVVDWVQDQGLSPGALAAGLRSLAAPPTPRAASEATDRITGPPARSEVLRLTLVHGPWIRWARAMAEVEVITRALEDAATPLDVRGAQVADARRAAALPEQLLGPASLLFRASVLSLRQAGDSLLLGISAPYTARGARLGQLGDALAPLTARSIEGSGAASVVVAGSPRHARALDETAPLAGVPLDRLLAETFACGFVCWPALWATIPSYARQPGAALGTVFPEVAPFAEPLTGAGGTAFIVEQTPRPGLGLAVRYPGGLAEVQARWRAALPTLEQRPMAQGREGVLLIGNSGTALDRLARGLTAAPVPTAALVEADFSGPVATLFGRFSARLTFAPEAMELETRWQLLPLAPPADDDAAIRAPSASSERRP